MFVKSFSFELDILLKRKHRRLFYPNVCGGRPIHSMNKDLTDTRPCGKSWESKDRINKRMNQLKYLF